MKGRICNIRQVVSDVLVIGGGGAGVTAAVAASERGAKVAMISKGEIGNSGNTIMIGGSYAMVGHSAYHKYGIKNADPTLTKEKLFESIVKDGFFMSDQNMVNQFVEESPEIVWDVKVWAEKTGRPFIFNPPATWWMSGHDMGAALKYGLSIASGIERYEDFAALELIKSPDGAICGTIALDIFTGELTEFVAKSVVMATGGFQPHRLKTTNHDMTGDGVAMAYRAGAAVSDMEFLLFLAAALEPESMVGSIFPLMYLSDPRLNYIAVDSNGKEYPLDHKLKEIEGKSELCKLIHMIYYGKIIDGENASPKRGFFIKFLNTDAELDEIFGDLIDMFANHYKKGFYHTDNLVEYLEIIKRKRVIEVGLGNEYTVGGIYVNEKMETTLPGLFAGGECASGVFGANRVADAVTEMLVQGRRAGISAAEYAKGRDANAGIGEDTAKSLLSVFDNTNGISPAEAVIRLENISLMGINCIRNEAGLNRAVNDFNALIGEIENITLTDKSRKYNYEWLQANQVKNRLTCSLLAALMGRERKESRGLHLRDDYPLIDNGNYLARMLAVNKDGKAIITKRPPIVTKVPLPVPGKCDYLSFITDYGLGLENIAGKEEVGQ
jgi:succinate dehydrogenase / fumarate reductase flavoprotein subunit